MVRAGLPYYTKGIVVKGFGRGSKDLGFPTANLPVEVVQNLPTELETGVYFGFAQLKNGEVREMALSIGWNPFYQNKMKTMEVHIFDKFEKDFYGQELKVIILDYVRPEMNFESVDGLIGAINEDIKVAREQLKKECFKTYRNDRFFDDV